MSVEMISIVHEGGHPCIDWGELHVKIGKQSKPVHVRLGSSKDQEARAQFKQEYGEDQANWPQKIHPSRIRVSAAILKAYLSSKKGDVIRGWFLGAKPVLRMENGNPADFGLENKAKTPTDTGVYA